VQYDELARAKANVLAQLKSSEAPAVEERERMQQVVRPTEEIAKLCDMLFAAASGDLATVQQAITIGQVDVNSLDYEKRSALMIAAAAGHLAIVELLIAEKAALNGRDIFGNTALSNAIRMGQRTVATTLRLAGAELGWSESQAAGQLCDETRSGKLENVSNLVNMGALPDAKDYDDRTGAQRVQDDRTARKRPFRIWAASPLLVLRLTHIVTLWRASRLCALSSALGGL